jgi:hypothetical protein
VAYSALDAQRAALDRASSLLREPRAKAIGRQPQRAPDGARVYYERQRPEQTTLYRQVQQHKASFIAQAEDAAGADLPQFVRDEFDAFLGCEVFWRLASCACAAATVASTSGSRSAASADGPPEFVEAPAQINEALQTMLHKVITRLMVLLIRRGVFVEDEVSTYTADNDGDSDECQAAQACVRDRHGAPP